MRKKLYALQVLLVAVIMAMPSAEVFAAPGYDQVAGAASLATQKEVVSYGMTPVRAEDIADGKYEVSVSCSSPFFRVESAALTVEDGEMTARLTMSSYSYLFVYMGTPEEAAAAEFDEYIPAVDVDDWDTFTIPVEALDKAIDCAAFSKKKEKWYPRKILLHASDLPADALDFKYPDYERIGDAVSLYDEENGTDTQSELDALYEEGEEVSSDAEAAESAGDGEAGDNAVEMEEDDGEYSIEVDLAGGSGRANVTSPTWLYVRDGKGYAKLLWSSPYYDYMVVDGVKYLNETTDGSNSTFTIPITVLDEPMEVSADTTAMGDPLAIEYTLTFYSASVGSKDKVPQESTKMVIVAALIIMVGGGIVNALVKRRRSR